MPVFFLVVFMFINVHLFGQLSVKNPNISSYIDNEQLGLQVNPNLTGTRSSRKNEEFDLNMVLFYQQKYYIQDDEIIGRLNGRLISEDPLSMYDILEEVRSNEQIALSNFALDSPEFQEMINQYNKILNYKNTDIEMVDDWTNSNNINSYYDPYAPYSENKTNKVSTLISTNNQYLSLKFASQKLFAQSFATNISNTISLYDMTQFLEKHYTNSMLEQKDLEFLIHYEKLKESYQKILSNYNAYLSNEAESFKSSFDPGDTNETFTVLLVGDNTQHMFSLRFALDGKKNYQSHNNIVWYLGYSLPLLKKDVNDLYNLFKNNDCITYYVKGRKRQIEFSLNKHFIQSARQLLELYVRGIFVQSSDVEFPIMRSN
ncbi:MAG: hypothetical protein ACRCVW_04835 [Brevinema sp.]